MSRRLVWWRLGRTGVDMPPARLSIREGMEPRPQRRLVRLVETADQQFDRRRVVDSPDRTAAFRAERPAGNRRRAEGRRRAARSLPVDISTREPDPGGRERAGMLLALPAGACVRIVGRADRLKANPAAETPAAIDDFCQSLFPASIRKRRPRLRDERARDRFRRRSCTAHRTGRQPGIRQGLA